MSIIKKAIRGGWERITSIGIVAGIAVLICAGIYVVRAMSRESTDDAFITGHIVSISARLAYVDKVLVTDMAIERVTYLSSLTSVIIRLRWIRPWRSC
jgi:multidrug resistance efflux pump